MIAMLQGKGAGEAVASSKALLVEVQRLAIEYAPKAALALVALVVGWIAVRVLVGLARRALGRAGVDTTLANFIANLLRMGLMTLVVLMAVDTLGFETTSFVAILGAAGFAVGFALKDSLGNFASGVMIMIFRPFRAGDFVEAGGTSGTVVEVGVFATVIKTGDNKKVIVSNSSITGGNITNYSAFPTRRVDMTFGIGYADDIDRAKAILEDILAKDERVHAEPAPLVAVAALADSSVNLLCRPWTDTADYWKVYWATHEEVKKRFDAAGVTIPFPQRDVHLHQVEAAS